VLYGHFLREVGRQTQAIDAYRQALKLRPGSGRAYWSLANLKTFQFAAAASRLGSPPDAHNSPR
jgi:cytochrome c-type biogenesis protein CcmH/NrfG